MLLNARLSGVVVAAVMLIAGPPVAVFDPAETVMVAVLFVPTSPLPLLAVTVRLVKFIVTPLLVRFTHVPAVELLFTTVAGKANAVVEALISIPVPPGFVIVTAPLRDVEPPPTA